MEPQVCQSPLIEVDGLFAKLECVQPTGSVKDRIADYIVGESERLGLLQPGMRIVEASSGNTGIALARVGRDRGYEVTIVMPEDMTEERKALIRFYGANLILCSKEGSFAEAVEIRDELALAPDVFCPDQFSNALNTRCHYLTTGQEILEQVEGPIDAFVAGVGTGGTLVGVGAALREAHPDVVIVAVEPAESAVMSGGEAGPHGINGIGDGFIPPIASDGQDGLHPLIDEVAVVSYGEALGQACVLRDLHGLCVGISSGANFAAARRLRKRFKTVVTIFADGYQKYESKGLCLANEPACPYREHCSARAEGSHSAVATTVPR
jgi:cysteine synthase